MFGRKERSMSASERQAYNSEFGHSVRKIGRLLRVLMVIAVALILLYFAFRMGQRFPDL